MLMSADVASALAPKLAFAAESGGAYPADFRKIHDDLIVIVSAARRLCKALGVFD